jgi:hypothetical protein
VGRPPKSKLGPQDGEEGDQGSDDEEEEGGGGDDDDE